MNIAPASPEVGLTQQRFQPEIQGLRAIAVLLVVGYHFRPNWLPGGYVGVDVFFVISGYLITLHLARELMLRGKIRVLAFWSRRIWRLLPASFTVLIVTFIAAVAFEPRVNLGATLTQIGAASVYIVNWFLGNQSVDYLARAETPSVVQHYWSLAVEEQFYLVWPLLLSVTVVWVFFARKIRHGSGSNSALRITGIVIGIAFLSSFIAGIVVTSYSPQFAYFNTFVRVWEFASGALVALWVQSGRWKVVVNYLNDTWSFVAGLASWIGLGLIAFATFTFSGRTPFPGWVAVIPVLGTISIILFGGSRRTFGASFIFRNPIASFLGDISYSLYLWHWPIICFALVILPGEELPSWLVIASLFASVGLAFATKKFIEDPPRRNLWLKRRAWPGFAFAALVSTTIFALTATVADTLTFQSSITQSQVNGLIGGKCFGAAAMVNPDSCPKPFERSETTKPEFAASDHDANWCLVSPEKDWLSCSYGSQNSSAQRIALVGDSHAAALVPSFATYLDRSDTELVTFMRTGCPGLTSAPINLPNRKEWEVKKCSEWSGRVLNRLLNDDAIQTVVFSSSSSSYDNPEMPVGGRLKSADVSSSINQLVAAGKQIILIRDVPHTDGKNIPKCIATSIEDYDPCTTAFDVAVSADNAILRSFEAEPSAKIIDLTKYFCDAANCHSVIGGVIVYWDDNHLSQSFALTLAPYLSDELTKVIGSPR